VIDYRDLLIVAAQLAGPQDATEAALRRSVSTLYYAYFHRLMRFVADGIAPGASGSPGWVKLYRFLEHRQTRDRLTSIGKTVPALRPFSQHFARLLEERQRADYDPAAFSLTREDVLRLIRETIDAGTAFDALTKDERFEVAVTLLLPERKKDDLQRKS
jgi:hypothetical protein